MAFVLTVWNWQYQEATPMSRRRLFKENEEVLMSGKYCEIIFGFLPSFLSIQVREESYRCQLDNIKCIFIVSFWRLLLIIEIVIEICCHINHILWLERSATWPVSKILFSLIPFFFYRLHVVFVIESFCVFASKCSSLNLTSMLSLSL